MAIQLPNPIAISAAQDTATKTAVMSVMTTASAIASIDLNTETKRSLVTVDNIRFPFVQRTFQTHVNNYPMALPSFLTLADAKSNYDTMVKIRDYKAGLLKALEAWDEISMVAENNAFEYVRQMYANAKKAQEAGTVPGIQSFIDDIAPLFEKTPSDTPAPPAP